MNLFQLSAGIDNAYRNYCSEAVCNPFEVEFTWCSDLVIAMVCEDHGESGAINQTINNAIACWKTNFNAMRDLVTSINFLAWWTFENEEYSKYSPLFSALYHETLDIVYSNLTDEEQVELWRILDQGLPNLICIS